ncbi:Alpha-D-glucose-1-phosphate phosphatase YihX [Stieleria bergensis]|uniref:Alpha-D-glucose-1-phosphate phosphatase YihX n=1 Tax=Stieleria bergensis TaxID=2528025 RepID=A0A517STV5_9BACT|nr:MAG: hypothetical protein CBB71_03150 [Rhodopirellula sp. TMED11]QDT59530.1 Alpha-D-glucose-1-phosphate phosphatase YihX [Planctomycetes bacterium SV_7m_r]
MANIEFVYFDLGNVLVRFDPALACRNLATLFAVSEQRAEQALYGSGLQTAYEHGELCDQEFAQQLCSDLCSDFISAQQTAPGRSTIAQQDVLDAISEMFTPIESMAGVVEDVRERLGRVGLLSNTCFAHWDWIRRQNWAVSKLDFEVTLLSCEVASMKPDAEIYRLAQQACGLAGEQILFLDDKAENVAAARNQGWHAECCFGGQQAMDALAKYL